MLIGRGADIPMLALAVTPSAGTGRIVFGFTHPSAPQLVSFLHKYRADMEHVTGVRYRRNSHEEPSRDRFSSGKFRVNQFPTCEVNAGPRTRRASE